MAENKRTEIVGLCHGHFFSLVDHKLYYFLCLCLCLTCFFVLLVVGIKNGTTISFFSLMLRLKFYKWSIKISKKVQALLQREKSVKFTIHYYVFICQKSKFKHKLNSLFYILNLKIFNNYFDSYYILWNLIFPKWHTP